MNDLLAQIPTGPVAGLLAAAFAAGAVAVVMPETVRLPTAGHREIRNERTSIAQVLGMTPTAMVAGVVGVTAVTALFAFVLFGGIVVALIAGVGAAFLASWSLVVRSRRLVGEAAAAWPDIIELIRVQVASSGVSIPTALVEARSQAPAVMRPAFDDARRVWASTGDMRATAAALTARLDDSMADTVCETLVVANEVGGSSIDLRLRELAAARRRDLQVRREATARLGGARFARAFVLLVPLGMALVGMSIGTGRAAYQTTIGQIGVVIALAVLAGCWFWASVLLATPPEPRVWASTVTGSTRAGGRR